MSGTYQHGRGVPHILRLRVRRTQDPSIDDEMAHFEALMPLRLTDPELICLRISRPTT